MKNNERTCSHCNMLGTKLICEDCEDIMKHCFSKSWVIEQIKETIERANRQQKNNTIYRVSNGRLHDLWTEEIDKLLDKIENFGIPRKRQDERLEK